MKRKFQFGVGSIMQVASWCSWILRYFAALTLWQWVWQVCYWITSQHMRSAYICILIWQFTCAYHMHLHAICTSQHWAREQRSKWRCSSAKYLEWRNNRFALCQALSQAGRKSIWPPVIISDLRLRKEKQRWWRKAIKFPTKNSTLSPLAPGATVDQRKLPRISTPRRTWNAPT